MLWSINAEIVESREWHDHDVFQFILCRDRNGRMLTAEGEIPFAPAKTILIPPNAAHRLVVKAGKVSHLKIVCFPPSDLVRFLSPIHVAMLDGLAKIGVSAAEHVHQEQWLRNLGESFIDGFGVDDVWVQRMHWGAIGLLLTLHAKEQHVASKHNALRHRSKIKDIVAWIEDNATKNITIEQAARKFSISRSLLTREFRGYTGKSFVEYCNSRRVQKAAVALVTRDDSVTQVALDNGFSNLSHFHRQFKAHFGMTPAAFRRKILEEGDLGGDAQSEVQTVALKAARAR
jgi:AraC family transcriptional activator of mar-sox-rob regulon